MSVLYLLWIEETSTLTHAELFKISSNQMMSLKFWWDTDQRINCQIPFSNTCISSGRVKMCWRQHPKVHLALWVLWPISLSTSFPSWHCWPFSTPSSPGWVGCLTVHSSALRWMPLSHSHTNTRYSTVMNAYSAFIQMSVPTFSSSVPICSCHSPSWWACRGRTVSSLLSWLAWRHSLTSLWPTRSCLS